MKLDKQALLEMIREEIYKLDKDGNQVDIGPKDDIDAIYHDSTRDDNKDGYTKKGKKQFTVRILKKDEQDVG